MPELTNTPASFDSPLPTSEQLEQDFDQVREKLNKNIQANIKILEEFDEKYETNLGQWYDNATDTLAENLQDEYQDEDIRYAD